MLQSPKIADIEKTASPEPVGGLGADVLSVALIGPDDDRRVFVSSALAGAPCSLAQQLYAYPDLDRVPRLIEMGLDVVLLDLDSDPEHAIELVETICASSQITVMVYSASRDSALMLGSMRAGAREYLTFPITATSVAEAMVRALARRSAVRSLAKAEGTLTVFCGAKGGTGVTTVATSFAVSAARETDKKVLLLDLDLPLGDTALQLGLNPQYGTVDALKNFARLDANMLSHLVAKHSSGAYLLAAPGSFAPFDLTTEAVNKLIEVTRQEFDCVVVDAGSRFQPRNSALFAQGATIYLVCQLGITELRNSNRIISELFPANLPKVEIVLNCHSSSGMEMDDEHITRALTRAVQWRIPEDTATLREMQNTATPVALGDSPVSKVIRQMARTACGLSAEPESKRKKLLGLF